MIKIIAKKNASLRPKINFMIIVRTKVRLRSTPKNFKKIVIWSFIIKKFKKGFDMCDKRGEPINQVSGSEKSFIPIFLRNRGRRKKMNTNFNNVTVLSLNRSILLMCMCENHALSLNLKPEGYGYVSYEWS